MTSRRHPAGVLALVVGVLLTAVTAVTSQATAASACAKQNLPPSIAKRPVVLVHGWNGGPGSWDKSVAALTAEPYRSNKSFRLLRYDYAKFSADWPNEREVSGCLAEFLVRVSRLWRAGGGDGQVLAVGHSMGGIALRFAAAQSFDGTKAGDILGGVVTLGTPHTGSPWGGTWLAALEQFRHTANNGPEMTPPVGSNAEICLRTQETRDAICDEPPLFPARIPLTTIGTQISINRDLFGFTLARFQLFGDGIVPLDSSTGYPRSGPTTTDGGRATMARGTDLTALSVPCEYSSSGLYAVGAALAQLVADDKATDSMLRGDAGVSVAEVTLAAYGKPCFHSGLTSEERVVADTYKALRRYAKALDTAAARQGLAAAIVGEWERHGASLTISSLTSGHQRFTLGYGGCGDENLRCFLDLELALQPEGSVLHATITKVRVTDENNAPAVTDVAGSLTVGATFTIRAAHPNLLRQDGPDTEYGETYWCNGETPTVYSVDQNLCGA